MMDANEFQLKEIHQISTWNRLDFQERKKKKMILAECSQSTYHSDPHHDHLIALKR
jgi:hypothetical protein